MRLISNRPIIKLNVHNESSLNLQQSFTTEITFRYLVNVYFNGSHIPNSPFKVRVCNPEAIWAEGPGLMDSFVGDQGDFQVFTRDAGHGTLSE